MPFFSVSGCGVSLYSGFDVSCILLDAVEKLRAKRLVSAVCTSPFSSKAEITVSWVAGKDFYISLSNFFVDSESPCTKDHVLPEDNPLIA